MTGGCQDLPGHRSAQEFAAQRKLGYCANLLGELRLSATTESLMHFCQIAAKSVVGSPIDIGHLRIVCIIIICCTSLRSYGWIWLITDTYCGAPFL